MEAINALHNKLQSLEEEFNNAQQHSHSLDQEITEIRKEREEELTRIAQVEDIIMRNQTTLAEKQEMLREVVVKNELMRMEIESASVGMHQLVQTMEIEAELFSKFSENCHGQMEKIYNELIAHHFLENIKLTNRLHIRADSIDSSLNSELFQEIEEKKQIWKEKALLKDVHYTSEEEKMEQQISRESLEIALMQDYIEHGNNVNYDQPLKGVVDSNQNAMIVEATRPRGSVHQNRNHSQQHSRNEHQSQASSSRVDVETHKVITNAMETVESFEMVVTPWYQEFKRRRYEIVTEEQQYFEEETNTSPDSFQTCWDMLQEKNTR